MLTICVTCIGLYSIHMTFSMGTLPNTWVNYDWGKTTLRMTNCGHCSCSSRRGLKTGRRSCVLGETGWKVHIHISDLTWLSQKAHTSVVQTYKLYLFYHFCCHIWCIKWTVTTSEAQWLILLNYINPSADFTLSFYRTTYCLFFRLLLNTF